MKIGEWDNLGRARALVQRQLGELNAAELAAHVTVNPDNARVRIYVATDIGLLDYTYGPTGADPEGAWLLRGSLIRWGSVRALRLQSDAQLGDQEGDPPRESWRMVADEPKIELGAGSDSEERAIEALLAFARACLAHAG